MLYRGLQDYGPDHIEHGTVAFFSFGFVVLELSFCASSIVAPITHAVSTSNIPGWPSGFIRIYSVAVVPPEKAPCDAITL